jgi:hypothetical protein
VLSKGYIKEYPLGVSFNMFVKVRKIFLSLTLKFSGPRRSEMEYVHYRGPLSSILSSAKFLMIM